MTWAQQRQFVNSLADRARDERLDAVRIRSKLKIYTSAYLGNLETLAWIFALGSFWAAAARTSAVESSGMRRSMIAAINTSVLAWQLVHRQFGQVQPVAGPPAEGIE